MDGLDRLLELQGCDTSLDQLRHRLRVHPLRAELRRLDDERASLAAEADRRRGERDDLLRQQRRWDDEVAKVTARRAEIEQALYGGSVTSPKELVALQADSEALKRRQGELEDSELEVMEQVEAVTGVVDDLGRRSAELDQRREELTQQLTVATAEIEVELERVGAQRQELADAVPPELLDRYDALRSELGGVAVARLDGSTCAGCHLTLSAVEVDRLRKLPADRIPQCEECGRILVR